MHFFKHGFIVFDCEGVLDERAGMMLVSAVSDVMGRAAEYKAKGVLISLKGIPMAQYDEGVLGRLVGMLDGMGRKSGFPVGLTDYAVPGYRLLKRLTESSGVKLFKNLTAARVFLDPKSFKQGVGILVYDEDTENAQQLTRELSKFGYSVVRAQSREEFQESVEQRKYEIFVTQSTLNIQTKKEPESKTRLALSKTLVTNLPVFMDTAVETLVSFTGLEAEKVSHSIRQFVLNGDVNVICAIMRFKGDVEGAFVLVFPTALASIAMEALLGEQVDETDVETLKDGVGEFCNIITGSTKTALQEKDVKVLFDLPRTHASLQSTTNDIGGGNGVWIEMKLAGKPFYMFITK